MLDIFELLPGWLRSDVVQQSLAEKQVGVGQGLLLAQPRLPRGDDVQRLKQVLLQAVPPRRDFFLHRERNPKIGRLSHRHAEESRWSHSDDGVDGGTYG